MYISAFSLLSGACSVPRKAETHYRDVLAAKRQWGRGGRGSGGAEREGKRGMEKLLTPQTPLLSQWRKKVSKPLSLPTPQPPARWRYYSSHLDRCKNPTVCVCVCVRLGPWILRWDYIMTIYCRLIAKSHFSCSPSNTSEILAMTQRTSENKSFVLNVREGKIWLLPDVQTHAVFFTYSISTCQSREPGGFCSTFFKDVNIEYLQQQQDSNSIITHTWCYCPKTMIFLPTAFIEVHCLVEWPSKGERKHCGVYKAEKASKINMLTQTAAVSIWTDTKWITRRKSEWLVQTLVSCLMHFHVALYLIIDHTGAALNRVCLPHRYKQLNNSLAGVWDRMWWECSRRISSLLFNPQFHLAAGQNGDSVRLNGRF